MARHNVLKRTLAGILAVLTVAAYLPANVGTGGLFGAAELTAKAAYDEATMTETIALTANENAGDKATISGTYDELTSTCKGLKMDSLYGYSVNIAVTDSNLVIEKIEFNVVQNMAYVNPNVIKVTSGTGTVSSATSGGKIVIENIKDSATITADGNAYGSGVVRISSATITYAEKAATTLSANDITVTYPENAVYDGTKKEVTVSLNNADDSTPQPKFSVSYYLKGKQVDPIDAGSYTVAVTVLGDDNYEETTIGQNYGFTIAKADPTATAPTAKTELYYNGQEQELVEAGTADGGTMVYLVDTQQLGINDESFEPSKFSEGIPTGSLGTYYVYYGVKGDDNHNSKYGGEIEVTIENVQATVTLPEGDVTIDGVTPNDDGVYTVTAGTDYTITSDRTLTLSGDTNGVTLKKTGDYTYVLNLELGTVQNGAKIELTHNHATSAYTNKGDDTATDKVWVECSDETAAAATIAKFNTEDTYYYGSAPTENDITITPQFGATAKVKEFYFSAVGDTSFARLTADNLEIGKQYNINATIEVALPDGRNVTPVISKVITYAARPMEKCEFYLGEQKLAVKDGVVTVPDTAFTYTGKEQKPVITVKNPANGEVLATTDYTDAVKAQTDAGEYEFTLTAADKGNYAEAVTVAWNIAKAQAKVNITEKGGRIYDGTALTLDDFDLTAADENDALTKEFLAQLTAAEGETAKTTAVLTPSSEHIEYSPVTVLSTTSIGDDPGVYFAMDSKKATTISITKKTKEANPMVLMPGLTSPVTYTAIYNGSKGKFKIESDGTLSYQYNDDWYEIPLTKGYAWYGEKSTTDDGSTLLIVSQKRVTTEYDFTSAGEQQGTVTLTNANFETVELPVTAEIAKRTVGITPAAGQSTVYSEAAPALNFTVEQAAENSKTGVIAGDEDVDFTSTLIVDGYDYEYYTTNAGTYSYAISTSAVLDNYQAVLADSTAVFTVKPKELTKEMFTIQTVNYTYDGERKTAPKVIAKKLYFENSTLKLTADDYVVGGTEYAVLPGTYTLEISGKGNYTGLVTSTWEIKSDKNYVVDVSVVGADKIYDGKPVSATSEIFEREDVLHDDPVSITGAKTVYTYYAIGEDGEPTKLDGAPKDAGSYRVVATTTAKGYAFDDVAAEFTIEQKEVAVTPHIESITYGDADPDFTNYTYDETAFIDGETPKITGAFGLEGYNGDAKTYQYDLGTLKIDSDNYKLTISGEYVVKPQVLTDENIIVFRKSLITDDGWAYPGDCVKVVATVNGEEVELNSQYSEETEHVIDYKFISATRTKNFGEFSVQIQGVGNYTGYAETMVDVVDAADLVTFTADAPKATQSNGKNRVISGFSAEVEDGYEITAHGILYSNNGTITDASKLTLEAVDKTNVKQGANLYSASLLDNGTGVVAVGYVTISDKNGYSTTVYSENIGASYAELAALAQSVTFTADAPKATQSNGKNRVISGFTADVKDGYEITAYGILYSNNGTITDASKLTLEAVDKTNVKQGASLYSASLLDNGTGVVAVGYVTVKDGSGNSVTLYSENIGGNYKELALAQSVTLTADAPKATQSNGKNRVIAGFTADVKDGYEITAYGILYSNNGTITDASKLTLDAVDKTNVKQGTSLYSASLLDNGTGVVVVGYVTVKDSDGNSKTLYTDNIGGSYADLA